MSPEEYLQVRIKARERLLDAPFPVDPLSPYMYCDPELWIKHWNEVLAELEKEIQDATKKQF